MDQTAARWNDWNAGAAGVGAVAGHRISSRRGRARSADAGAFRARHAHVDGRRASRASAAKSLFRAGAAAGGGPLRNIHSAQFFPLVSVLGTEPDTGVLPH